MVGGRRWLDGRKPQIGLAATESERESMMKRKLSLAAGRSDGPAAADPASPAVLETAPVADIAQEATNEAAALSRALAALQESEARYRVLTDLSSDWYWEQDEHQRFKRVTRNDAGRTGIPQDALIGKTRRELSEVRWDEPELAALEALTASRQPFRAFEIGRACGNGPRQFLSLSGEPMYDAAGRYCGYRGIGREITERIQAERAIRTNSMQQGLIAKFGQQALAVTDIDVLLASAVAAVVDGLGADCCSLLRFGPDGRPIVLQAGAGWADGWLGRELIEAGPGTQIGYVIERREPVMVEDFATESRFKPAEILTVHGIRSGLEVMIGGAGAPYGILGGYSRRPCMFAQESVNFLQSIANVLGTAIERRHAEEKLAYLARYDSLTGLANREMFRDRLAQSLAKAERDESMVGILYIDLDGFKNVNDSHGHDTGDKLLTLVAQRLQSCVRKSDTVGRLGGDEFAIVVTGLADADTADVVAEKVVEQLARPFDLDGRETLITASIGISIYPVDGTDANLLLKNADTAMYQGKEQGRNNFQNYSVELDHAAAGRRQLALEMRHAIEHQEFELHYQPQVSLESGRIIGAEAFLRWWHPAHGMLAAGEFIEVAEETGLIVEIGQWVFETACKQAAEWQRSGFPDIFVAVNVSPVEIRRGKVVEQARQALEHSGLAPRHLEIELTESVVIDDAETFASTLAELKDLGISIAIDDFGTGYSSLSSLKNFPINKVKINQSFTRDIVAEPDDGAIVQAVIAMAHHLQLEVVSKGVETERQAGFLRRCRCDMAQGYLFGAPMQARYFKDLLDDSDGRLLPVRASLNGPVPHFSLEAVA
jgi:diguanylate cyclase (GGDEF)-like protein/PAS domain S-box-containing protein